MKWLDGEEFSQNLNKFIKPLLIKGAPSVIQDLKEFYCDAQKVAAIEKLLLSYLENMNATSVLEKDDKVEQDPTVMLWLMYFISHHYLFKKDVENALKFVNQAIEHTPTLIDLYTLKGKIMQVAGNRTEASRLFEEARVLDQADRALNAIAACYQVKAG
jgi:tetratricopeptide (TPR) repeat protein